MEVDFSVSSLVSSCTLARYFLQAAVIQCGQQFQQKNKSPTFASGFTRLVQRYMFCGASRNYSALRVLRGKTWAFPSF